MRSFKIFKIFILLTTYINIANSAPEEEKVEGLFGELYSGSIYSGYLNTADSNRKLHYVFLLSQSDPKKDPVVLWLNGGPGCSSLLGLFMEHGPVVLDDYDPNWKVNDYSWNKNANMIYLESPAGVGFSYTKNGDIDLASNDSKSAIDNLKALQNFFEKFPEFKENEFYISGESYAGVYVPWLAKTILQNKSDINLKGVLVGNGLTDVTVDVEEALIQFAYDHTLYPPEIYNEYNEKCSDSYKPTDTHIFQDFHPKNVTKACNNVRQNIRDSLQGLNIYDIYRPCPESDNKTMNYQQATLNTLKAINKYHKKLTYLLDEPLEPELHIWPNGCAEDQNLGNFLNNQTIKSLLHVDPQINWIRCNDDINGNYTIADASFSIYKETLIPNKNLKVWFYSGDTDAAVPFTGTIRWIPKLNLNVTEEYRAWSVNSQTAGYVQSYDNFKYITVKGTGHMAPQWKRVESFIMFNSFLKGEKLPK
jgi:carboxypeptidase C (cathepsin A)